jgi:hypothetical protein
VPHAEGANTASFLEECITYIQGLQKRIAELEHLAGVSQMTISHPASAVLPGDPSLVTGVPISLTGTRLQPTASVVLGPATSRVPFESPDLHQTAATTAW